MKTRLPVILLSAAVLSACASNSETPKLDYQTENRRIVSLDVPPDLNNPSQGSRYTLPQGGAVRASELQRAQQQAAQNGNNAVLSEVKGMSIERDGGERWLHIEGKTPAQLWGTLHGFWRENGFVIAREEPNAGIMETDWAENRAKLPNDGIRRLFDRVGLGGVYSTGERDKFIVRLERTRNGGTNVFISHRGMQETYADNNKDTTMWQPAPRNSELEAAFLSRLMQHLGADEASAQRQVAESRNNPNDLATLDGNRLIVRGDYERTWRRVGLALDRIGLNTTGEDSQRGAIRVQVAPAEGEAIRNSDNRGFFGRLFGRENRATEQNLPEFVVVVRPHQTGSSSVSLANLDGSPYSGRDAQTWLNRLHNQLR